jgi:hypothetical protein
MAGANDHLGDVLQSFLDRKEASGLSSKVFRVCMLKAGFTKESRCVKYCDVDI